MLPGKPISIWFFIGISLLVNGALIVGAGLYELVIPPASPSVRFQLHANIWWGGVLLLAGVVYIYHYWPGRQESSDSSS